MLKDQYESALSDGNIQAIQEIVLDLNGKDPAEKKKHQDLYTRIGDDLFAQGVKIKNYDASAYARDILDASPVPTVKKKTRKIINQEKTFDELFCEFYNKSHHIFPDLKYHFLFKLEGKQMGEPGFYIITDERFSDHPLIDKIKDENTSLHPQQYTFKQFEQIISNNLEIFSTDSLWLLAISPTVGLNSEFQSFRELFPKIEKCQIIHPRKPCDLSPNDYTYHSVDQVILDDIEKITTNFLNNKAINHEEEKLIKMLLSKNLSITDYAILKSGFSGSKVIAVQPVKNYSGISPIKNIIKFSVKTPERKIHREKVLFSEYLAALGVYGYACEYLATDQYEGILYNYASGDSRKDSYSFASLINEYTSKKELKHDLILTIDQLFKCEPFKKWIGRTPVRKKVKDIYKDYLNPDKIFIIISILENVDSIETKKTNLYSQYHDIEQYEMDMNQKICHGDLHTENFFKDDKDVYLIDFGYTGIGHALLDYSTLEASIKFKHIPFYIPCPELIDIERRLLNIDTFKENYDLSFIKRPIVKHLFEVILKIRREAVMNLRNESNILEYFISLFLISFRQIQYRDLNQRYALESSKVLGDYVHLNLSL